MSFDGAFAHTVGIEGGYSNNPADKGGPTKFGITERVARANGYNDDMEHMPLEVAKAIYKKQYWDLLQLDAIDAVAPDITIKLFDQAVNMGVATAGTFLQRALNVLNRNAQDYPDLKVDGVVGPVTVADLKLLINKRGADGVLALSRIINGLQVARYVEIAEKDPTQEAFEFGWIKTRTT